MHPKDGARKESWLTADTMMDFFNRPSLPNANSTTIISEYGVGLRTVKTWRVTVVSIN